MSNVLNGNVSDTGLLKGSISDTGTLKGSISAILGKDGKDGTDGISATHSWDGTILTVTSASGTSSADLKGDKGDVGVSPYVSVTEIEGGHRITVSDKEGTYSFDVIDGKPGRGINYATVGSDGRLTVTYTDGTQYISAQSLKGKDGTNGTSVGVSGVSTSTEDGGSNTVTFSDGNSLTIKNGSKGGKGDKGDKGDTGNPGVYIGSGDMPDGYSVQIDPSGKALFLDDFIRTEHVAQLSEEIKEAVLAAIPVGDEVEY